MICPKCGAYVSKNIEFCELCNAQVNVSKTVPAVSKITKTDTLNPVKTKKTFKIIFAILAAIIIISAFWFLIVQQNKERERAELISQLTKDWSRIEGKNGTYIKCILDFSDDEIEYRVETSYSWLDMSMGTYNYRVIDGNTIEIDITHLNAYYHIYKITFNNDKTMMTVTPALTSTDNEENWFNLK